MSRATPSIQPTETSLHHLVRFEYPLPDPLPHSAPDMKELAAYRMLALSIVKQAWEELRHRDALTRRKARQYLEQTFWEANHLWRMLISDVVCEETWRSKLGKSA